MGTPPTPPRPAHALLSSVRAIRLPSRDRGEVLAWVAALLAASLVGAVVALDERVGLALLALTLVVVGVWLVVRIFAATRPRPLDVAVTVPILALPLMPYLASLGLPGASALRFAIAIVPLALMVAGAIAIRRPALAHGGFFVLFFAAYQVIPFLGSPDASYSVLRLANWLMFVPYAFLAYDERAFRVAAKAAVLSALVVFGGLLLQQAGLIGGAWGGLQIGGSHSAPIYATRYTSFLLNPNDLALFMFGVAVVAAIVATFGTTHWPSRLLLGLVVLAAGVAVLASNSRGAFLSVPLVLVYLFAAGARRQVTIAIVAVGLAAIFVIPTLPVARSATRGISDSLTAIVTGSDTSARDRQAVWQERLDAAGNPVIGSGYGTYGGASAFTDDALRNRQQLLRSLTVDNSWLKMLLESGIVGVLLMGAVLVAWIVNTARAARSPRLKATALSLGALGVLLLFRSFSVDVLDINPWNFFLWLLFGMTASLAALARRADADDDADDGPAAA
jgi:O-antigen ligase